MSDQAILATTLVILMGLLIWGKWRYDAVTLICLAALVLLGIVPANDAFSGFGHPAVVTVALVLLISRGHKRQEWLVWPVILFPDIP